MVPNNEKLLEAFIGGLPRSIEGNVTASKPQTLEEAINISQRIEDKKPSKFILPPMGILGIVPCAKDVDYITQDLAVSSVSFATRWHRHSTAKQKINRKTTLRIFEIIRIFLNLKNLDPSASILVVILF
ncbi:hypothetical protein Tco_0462194 [Tanacetum coccineum]